MELIDFTCPHCGAQLEVKAGQQKAICRFCDSEMLIEHRESSSSTSHTDNSDQHSSERQQEYYTQPLYVQPAVQPAAARKKRHTFRWVMGWIFIFPIPATILTYRSDKLKPVIKVLIIAAVWLVYLLLIFSKK